MSDSFWIITTFAAGAAAVIFLLLNVVQWFFAKSEGRFFISRGLGGSGLDLIRHQPMSNRLSLQSLKWKGRLWIRGKEGMLFGLDKIQNPTGPDDHLYNDLVSRSCNWDGARRPVAIATDVMSTVITPAFYAAVALSESFDRFPNAKNILQEVAAYAKEYKLDTVTVSEAIQPDNIKKYLKDVGPSHIREAFNKGVEAQKLAATRPPGEGIKMGGMLMYIGLALLVVLLVYFGMPFVQRFLTGIK